MRGSSASELAPTAPGGVAEAVSAAAVRLFAEQGYTATSVREIVAAAGVTKGAMYHYFASKDDLLFGIYDRLLGLQQQRLDAIIARGGRPDEVLRAACRDVVDSSIEYLDEGTVFFRSAHLLTAERRAEVARRRRTYHDSFSRILREGQDAGIVRRDIAVAVLTAHFFSDVHYLSQWYSSEGALTPAQLADDLATLFLDGIRPSGSPSAAPTSSLQARP